jgi:phosphate transport system substrate-binding protein
MDRCAALAVLAAFVLVAGQAAAQGLVRIDGSSTVFPIVESAAPGYRRAAGSPAGVAVAVSGSAGGLRKFCRGELDLANASRPIQRAEMVQCAQSGVRYFELPVGVDALTVVVHPSNDWLEGGVTLAELRRIWEPAAQGRVLRWNQVNPKWPDLRLRLYGPGADSGTFEYFTEAIAGKARASRRDYTASEDDEVLVQAVSRDRGALGYFGYAYYAENAGRLKAVPIVWREGAAPARPSLDAVLNGSYRPLSRPLFVYVSAASLARKEVASYVQYFLAHAADHVVRARYVPLPEGAYAQNRETLARGRAGTRFGGETRVGLTIEELMSLEVRL